MTATVSDTQCKSDKTTSEFEKPQYDLDALLKSHNAIHPETGAVNLKNDFLFISDAEQLWNTSVVLLNYFEKVLLKENPDYFRGKTILEIGSGLGHLAFMLKTKYGANVICTEHPNKYETLKNSLINQQARCDNKDESVSESLESSESDQGSIRSFPLLWGESGWKAAITDAKDSPLPDNIDLILCVECIYDENTHDDLLYTWNKLATKYGSGKDLRKLTSNSSDETDENMNAITPKKEQYSPLFYIAFVNRPFSWNFFAKMDDFNSNTDFSSHFEVESISKFDNLGMEDIHIHRCYYDTPVTKSILNENHNDIDTNYKSNSKTPSKDESCALPSPSTSTEAPLTGDEKSQDRKDKLLLDETTDDEEEHLNGNESNEDDNLSVTSQSQSKSLTTTSLSLSQSSTNDSESTDFNLHKTNVSSAQKKLEGGDSLEKSKSSDPNESDDSEKNIWEILDELIGIDPRKLRIYVQCAVLFLMFFTIWLIKNAWEQQNMQHVYLHSGFLFCVVGLSLSVEFVLAEAERLTRQQKLEKELEEKKKLENSNSAETELTQSENDSKDSKKSEKQE